MTELKNPDLADVLSQYCEGFTFRARPEPIHFTHRADYRIALILLMIQCCARGGKISLIKLHVLNWASRKALSRKALLDRLAGKRDFRDIPIRFDPSFNRAIDLARGEALIFRDPNTQSIAMSPSGQSIATELQADKAFMTSEKMFFTSVGKKLTDAKVNEIINPQTLW